MGASKTPGVPFGIIIRWCMVGLIPLDRLKIGGPSPIRQGN
jgi:hypothetical protein